MTDAYTFTMLIFGAIGGLFRTYVSHGSKFILPSVNIHKKTIRLGFVASMMIGAAVAYMVHIGVVVLFPTEIPASVWTSSMVGFVSGFSSLTILEKVIGIKIRDPDTAVIPTFAPLENNYMKMAMYDTIAKEVPEVERIVITDGETAGVMKVIVVPRKNADGQRVRNVVENIINRMKCPGVQAYIYLPNEKVIDINLTVEVMDGTNIEETKRENTEKIRRVITNYINSLRPGSPVRKSQIIAEVVKLSPLIRDVRGDRIIGTPPFISGSIPIGKFEVARAGEIDVEVIVITPGESIG